MCLNSDTLETPGSDDTRKHRPKPRSGKKGYPPPRAGASQFLWLGGRSTSPPIEEVGTMIVFNATFGCEQKVGGCLETPVRLTTDVSNASSAKRALDVSNPYPGPKPGNNVRQDCPQAFHARTRCKSPHNRTPRNRANPTAAARSGNRRNNRISSTANRTGGKTPDSPKCFEPRQLPRV